MACWTRKMLFSPSPVTRFMISGSSSTRKFSLFLSNGKSHRILRIQPLTFVTPAPLAGVLPGTPVRHFSLSETNFNGITAEALSNSPLPPMGTIFSDTAPVLAAQDLLLALKDIPGVTWIQTIILGTIAIRVLFALPLTIVQQKSLGRLENLQPEFKSLAEELKRETSIATKIYKWDQKTARTTFRRSYKKHWRKLVEDHNCHPMRALSLGLLQVPVWICFSSAIRNVVYQVPLPITEEMTLRWMEMNAESTYWLDAITMADPIVFPAVFVVANLANIQLHSLNRSSVPQTTLQKVVPWIFRIGVCGVGVFATYVPAAVSMYWATSSAIGFVQNGAMLNSKVRQLLRIPVKTVAVNTVS